MNCHKFTEAEDRTILEMRAAGKPWAAIGRALELGYETCKYRFTKHLDPESRHVKKRKIVREEPIGLHLKFNPDIKLNVQYEDDPRGVLPEDGGIARPPVLMKNGKVVIVNGKMVWAEDRSRARGEYDWGLNPVDPRRR